MRFTTFEVWRDALGLSRPSRKERRHPLCRTCHLEKLGVHQDGVEVAAGGGERARPLSPARLPFPVDF
ncbi:MAG TPA: hypothetical protein VHR45_09470 [Thermoanaerobaculia bacterium]|nr:hypothetical protein [Thermoanaerobaculia bacterium]